MTWKHSTHATAKHITVKHFKEIGEKWKHMDYFSSSPELSDNLISIMKQWTLADRRKISMVSCVFHAKQRNWNNLSTFKVQCQVVC
jgi:hypothetical protein